MTRKDLRQSGASFNNHETKLNQIAARNLALLKAREARRQASAKTLKRLLIGLLLIVAMAVLWSTQQDCEAKAANPAACVD